jgi:hypothetical protein
MTTSNVPSLKQPSAFVPSAELSGGHYDLYQKPASGAAKEVLLLHGGANAFPSDWSRDANAGGCLSRADGKGGQAGFRSPADG